MSNIVAMECSLGHRWVLPLSGTSYVAIPERCPKVVKHPQPAIAAPVVFAAKGRAPVHMYKNNNHTSMKIPLNQKKPPGSGASLGYEVFGRVLIFAPVE